MAHFPTRTKIKHHLQSFKDDPSGWVELYTDPDVAEIEQVYANESLSSFTKGLVLLASLITSWGFTEVDGTTPAPITLDNVRQLGLANIDELLELVNLPNNKSVVSPKASASSSGTSEPKP